MILASGSSSRAQGGAYSNVGSIVGQNAGAINIGMAWGGVAGGSYSNLGGIAGVNYGGIDDSIAASKIDYRNNAGQIYGGLVGINYGVMQGNFAQGQAALVPPAGINYGVMDPPYYYF
ncbi:hypothetical protein D9M72_257100 [compost metagenome]